MKVGQVGYHVTLQQHRSSLTNVISPMSLPVMRGVTKRVMLALFRVFILPKEI